MLYVNVAQLDKVDRQFLVERHLISREHAEGQGTRAVAIDAHEKFSLMINEEDHLRIQVMQSGLDLDSVWEQINRIDDLIEEKVTYAFHDRLGYLTACPTNVGTGMRVSVMLHLPALVITRQIDKVFRSLQKISLAVRGLYGEGSQAMGDFYQISNQVTLGRTESELIRQVSDIVPVIIDYERQAREFLVNESHENLHDRVSRAYGILRTAQTISSEETMHLLSQRADGRQPGPDPRPEHPGRQRAFHPHAAGPSCRSSPAASWTRPTATSSVPAISAATSTRKTATGRRANTTDWGPTAAGRTCSCRVAENRYPRQSARAAANDCTPAENSSWPRTAWARCSIGFRSVDRPKTPKSAGRQAAGLRRVPKGGAPRRLDVSTRTPPAHQGQGGLPTPPERRATCKQTHPPGPALARPPIARGGLDAG